MSEASLFRFLEDPASYPGPAAVVVRVETLRSWLFIADEVVYRLRKPIKSDGVDWSTPEARRKAYQREIRLNAPLAPDVYRDITSVYRRDPPSSEADDDSSVAPSYSFTPPTPDAEPVEFLLCMRRLPAERLLDHLLEAGGVTAARLEPLATLLVGFFRAAKTSERIARGGAPGAVDAQIRATLKTLRENLDRDPTLDRLESALLEFLGRSEPRFDDRRDLGRIREVHGDLRCEHVWLPPEEDHAGEATPIVEAPSPPPIVFGRIESPDRLRGVDVLEDVATLCIDLAVRGGHQLADDFWRNSLARPLGEAPDDPLFDFYRTFRALGRARLALGTTNDLESAAALPADVTLCRRYLEYAAETAARFYKPRLLVMVGLMGTGKSTLATALAKELGIRRIAAEDVRRETAQSAPRPAPGSDLFQTVYLEMIARAEAVLARGASIILDATFLRAEDRGLAVELAERTGAKPLFLVCVVADADAISRLDQRYRRDRTNQECRPELYDDQREAYERPVELPTEWVLSLHTNQPIPD
ncbi:MAG: AAA family ATPase, partial [Planctomycetia bacterium]